MLSPWRPRTRLAAGSLATVLLATVLLADALVSGAAAAAAPSVPRTAHRVLVVAPSLGMPGTQLHLSGGDVPRHVTYRVYFDVTTTDKRLLCADSDGSATRWRCVGRVPTVYGPLGLHTVEMDATTTSGKGGFEELATFDVTDLGVSLSAPATTAPGDTVQLRVTVANGDTQRARQVRVADTMPHGLRVSRVTAPCTQRRGHVACGPLTMAPHTLRSFVITAIVTASHATTLVDTVAISGHPDPIRKNDVVRAPLRVT